MADAEDAAEIVSARARAFQKETDFYGRLPDSDFLIPEAMAKNFSCPEYRHYILIGESGILGGVSFRTLPDGAVHIGCIYVLPELQGHGIGKQLMRHVFSLHPEAPRFTLETPYRSLYNHRFYESLGFVKTGETEPEPDGFRLWIYEKGK